MTQESERRTDTTSMEIDPKQARIRRTCLDLMFEQTRTAWMSNAFCLVLIWFAFWENASHTWLLGWTVMVVLLMALRELQSRRYASLTGKTINLVAWTRWLEASLLINGSLWGAACAALTLIANPYQWPVILLIAGGLQTGSVLASSYLMRAFTFFSLPLFLGTLAAFLVLGFSGEPKLFVTAALLAVWSLFIFICAARFGNHYRRSLGYSFELQDHQNNLERQVEMRTSELSTAKARAENADRAKSQFLANMSHEIRTPLNGILGIGEILLMDPLPPEKQALMQTQYASGQSLLRLVNDILDISKIQAGDVSTRPENFDLEALLCECLTLYEHSSQNAKLTLTIHYPEDAPRAVHGDSGRIQQIVRNLVSNAIKFTKEGSVKIVVQKPDTTGVWCIDVVDTGIGIATEKIETVFDTFSQADYSSTRQYGGAGLGLSISQNLAEILGGTLSVISELNVGSTFTLRLPLAPVTEVTAESAPLPETMNTQNYYRVLLVEDNEVNQLVAVSILEQLGHSVSAASSGEAALDVLENESFDLILMDCQMPGMDGFEATRVIRQRELKTLTSTPVIALTANAMPGDRQRCLDAGMDDYLAKPYTGTQLQAVMERTIGQT
ncbi:MAG: response regulator [Halioglobus sp.]